MIFVLKFRKRRGKQNTEIRCIIWYFRNSSVNYFLPRRKKLTSLRPHFCALCLQVSNLDIRTLDHLGTRCLGSPHCRRCIPWRPGSNGPCTSLVRHCRTPEAAMWPSNHQPSASRTSSGAGRFAGIDLEQRFKISNESCSTVHLQQQSGYLLKGYRFVRIFLWKSLHLVEMLRMTQRISDQF